MSTRSSASELRKLEIPDLLKEVTEKSSSAMKLRLGLQAGSNKDSSKYRQLKKEIAPQYRSERKKKDGHV